MGEMISRDWVLKNLLFDVDRDVVMKAPEVDAEPMRHGRWERIIEFNCNPYESEIEEKCSLCGRCVQRYGTQPQDNYCPYCGAKMDGGAENDKNRTECNP